MTPEQEEQVRRALAALGDQPAEAVPPPPAVVARLDATLAALAADRGTAATEAAEAAEVTETVEAAETTETHARPHRDDELAARRRRRAPRVLLAAAAVAAVAAVGGAIATGRLATGSDSSASSSSAGGSTSDSQQANGTTAGRLPRSLEGSAGSGSRPPAPSATSGAPVEAPVAGTPSLHRATLGRDLGRLLRRATGATDSGPLPSCRRPSTGPRDRTVGVRLDGSRATLVLGPAAGGRRTARVYACTTPGAPLVSTTVPAGS